ncbi:MAG: hypothetical protein FH753_13120 [Firmicutes bacterium]|nr:hypothetical protein [Bacillota bacterium]
MNLSEFSKEIMNSNIDDWTINSCWGAGAGPSYLNQFTVWNTGDDKFHNIEIDSHSMIASYKRNLAISIAWGLNHNDDFCEDWANDFPDSRAMSSYIDFFYNGVLVYRDIIVSVDGGRCYIPLPKREFDKKNHKVTRLSVTRQQYEFIKMINQFASTYNYDSYFKRTNIEIVEENWF